MMRNEKLDDIMLCSSSVPSSRNSVYSKCFAEKKKKSSGSFLGNVANSIASGVTNFFSGSVQPEQ